MHTTLHVTTAQPVPHMLVQTCGNLLDYNQETILYSYKLNNSKHRIKETGIMCHYCYVIVISQAGVGYHCYYTRWRSSINNNDILRVLVI